MTTKLTVIGALWGFMIGAMLFIKPFDGINVFVLVMGAVFLTEAIMRAIAKDEEDV